MVLEAWHADAIARYRQLCADPKLAGPDVVAGFVAQMRDAGLTFAGTPQCRSLRPLFITRNRLAELRRAVGVLCSAFDEIDRRALADESLARALGMSDGERLLAAVDPGYRGATVVSRLDALLSETLSFVEYNADSPAGISYENGQASLLRALPVMETFANEFKLEHLDGETQLRAALLSTWAEFRSNKMPDAPQTPSVAIVDLAGAPTTAEFHLVEADLKRNGVPAIVAAPEDLSYDGYRLHAFGREIQLVYKRVLVSEFLERYDLEHPLARAYRDGSVCVASSFRCKIAHKKKALAVMTDPLHAPWFTDEQREAIDALVPRVWPLADDDVMEMAERERHNFLIKPNDDYGGRGIVLGWEVTAEQWRAALRDGAAEGAVLQEKAELVRETFPIFDPDAPDSGLSLQTLYYDCDPFVFRGRLGALLTRLSNTPIINVARGGQAIPTFVIAPKNEERRAKLGEITLPEELPRR